MAAFGGELFWVAVVRNLGVLCCVKVETCASSDSDALSQETLNSWLGVGW